MDAAILNALDDLSSPRASMTRRSRALNALERVLADICIPAERREEQMQEFRRLQDGFECNISSRVMSFLSVSLPHLQHPHAPSPGLSTPATPSHSHNHTPHVDPASLATAITRSLSLLQGLALLHKPSQAFLARKANLQLLLDILLLSRPSHGSLASSSMSQAADKDRLPSGAQGYPSPVPLSPLTPTTPGNVSVAAPTASNVALAVLDTLLCVLVDSPRALRAFEDANGLEAIVRTLKRAGVPRDVRMKCLEFLYFYLLPETTSASRPSSSTPKPASRIITPPSPFLAAPSQSTASEFSRAYKNLTPPTPAPDALTIPALSHSRSASPTDTSDLEILLSPRKSNPNARDELERFVPATPKRAKVARIGVATGTPRHPTGSDIPALCISTPSRSEGDGMRGLGFCLLVQEREAPVRQGEKEIGDVIRTTEEKKERLGAWLGNVDQLVEGVRKAGVWGLA